MQINSWEKRILHRKTISITTYKAEKKKLNHYMPGKKFLTPERFGEKILPQTKSVTSPTPTLSHKRPIVVSTIWAGGGGREETDFTP